MGTRLEYNGVIMDEVRTLSIAYSPEMDPTGRVLECTKVTLQVSGVIHDRWVATEKMGALNNYGDTGDRMPWTVFNIRNALIEPRKQLKYLIGGEIVLEAPQRDEFNRFYNMDVKGGPFPDPSACRITQVIGDRAALFQWSCTCYVSDCENLILSNRYKINCTHDEHGYTRKVITGRAAFRLDFLDRHELTADDFRQVLILPCEERHRRVNVVVDPNEDGDEITYTVVDQETNYGTGGGAGGDLGITKIECQATTGAQYEGHDVRGIVGHMANIKREFDRGKYLGAVYAIWNRIVPRPMGNIVVRVWGQTGVDRRTLLRVCRSFVADRFAEGLTLLGDPKTVYPASAYLSVDWSSDNPPFVELRVEVFLTSLSVAWSGVWDSVEKTLNWSPSIQSGLGFTATRTRTVLPQGGNTRGAHIARLVTRALSNESCASAQWPPDPSEDAQDSVPGEMLEPGDFE